MNFTINLLQARVFISGFYHISQLLKQKRNKIFYILVSTLPKSICDKTKAKTVDLLQNFFVNETTFHYTFPSKKLAMSSPLTISEVFAHYWPLILGPCLDKLCYYKCPIILNSNDFPSTRFELLLF